MSSLCSFTAFSTDFACLSLCIIANFIFRTPALFITVIFVSLFSLEPVKSPYLYQTLYITKIRGGFTLPLKEIYIIIILFCSLWLFQYFLLWFFSTLFLVIFLGCFGLFLSLFLLFSFLFSLYTFFFRC